MFNKQAKSPGILTEPPQLTPPAKKGGHMYQKEMSDATRNAKQHINNIKMEIKLS